MCPYSWAKTRRFGKRERKEKTEVGIFSARPFCVISSIFHGSVRTNPSPPPPVLLVPLGVSIRHSFLSMPSAIHFLYHRHPFPMPSALDLSIYAYTGTISRLYFFFSPFFCDFSFDFIVFVDGFSGNCAWLIIRDVIGDGSIMISRYMKKTLLFVSMA